MQKLIQLSWYIVSFLLLAIYLTYFHMLNVCKPEQVVILGAVFGSLWMVTCFVCQSVFRNRFEFGIHTLITIDFFLEAMTTVHRGYGFYFCALSFWVVFLVYHHLPLIYSVTKNRRFENDPLVS